MQLDQPIPKFLAVGLGNSLPVYGVCSHPDSDVVGLGLSIGKSTCELLCIRRGCGAAAQTDFVGLADLSQLPEQPSVCGDLACVVGE